MDPERQKKWAQLPCQAMYTQDTMFKYDCHRTDPQFVATYKADARTKKMIDDIN